MLLWLGTGSPDVAAALKMLAYIGDKTASLGSQDEVRGDTVSSSIANLLQKATRKDSHVSHDYDESLSPPMQDIVERNEKRFHFPEPATLNILGRPWWSRV